MRAGAPTERAIGTVAVALGGPVGTALLRVRDGLRMGLDSEDRVGGVAYASGGGSHR